MEFFFWFVFSCIETEYEKIWTRKKSVFGHFLRSGCFAENVELLIISALIIYHISKILFCVKFL